MESSTQFCKTFIDEFEAARKDGCSASDSIGRATEKCTDANMLAHDDNFYNLYSFGVLIEFLQLQFSPYIGNEDYMNACGRLCSRFGYALREIKVDSDYFLALKAKSADNPPSKKLKTDEEGDALTMADPVDDDVPDSLTDKTNFLTEDNQTQRE